MTDEVVTTPRIKITLTKGPSVTVAVLELFNDGDEMPVSTIVGVGSIFREIIQDAIKNESTF